MNSGGVDCAEQVPWHPGTLFSRDRITDSNNVIYSDDHYNSYQSIIEEELEETKEQPSYPYFTSSLFCTVLEDALIQIRILEKCNNHLKIIKTNADKPRLTALKFKVETPEVVDELEGIDRRDLNNTVYKINKLDADRKHINDVILNLYLELAFHATSRSLQDINEIWNTRDAHRAELEADEAKNKITRRDLTKQVRQQRNHFKSVIYDSDVTIDNLKSQVEDFVQISETGSRYVVNWEVARTEQHLKTIDNIEKRPMKNITYYKQRFEHEVRVHNEIELLVNIIINETLNKVEEWMDKYDHDIEHTDIKIQLRKHEYFDALAKRKEMEQTLLKRDQLMKDWIKFKDDREKLRLYKEKMTKAAIVVQAWWRGLLVRCHLGPFKHKKKKKGRNK